MGADRQIGWNVWWRPGLFWPLAALAYLAVAMALYAPAIGETNFIYGTDVYSHDYVFHLYGWNIIRDEGRLPLWCPYLFCGFPIVASFALCPFYPSQLLYFVLPHNAAFTMQYVLALWVAGLAFAWWMRVAGLRRPVALWSGMAFLLCGHFLTLTYAGHLQKVIAIAWAPMALGGAHMLAHGCHETVASRWRAWRNVLCGTCAMGFAMAMQLLASHTQIFYATLVTCVLYAALGAAGRGAWYRRLGVVAAGITTALAICVALSGAQLLPSLEMSAASNRAEGVRFEEAVETSYPPIELTEFVISRTFGDSVVRTQTPYFGYWGERIVSDYIGIPIVLLALGAAWLARRRLTWYLAGLVVCSLLVAFGRYTPLYRVLYEIVPGMRQFRSPGTFMFITSMSLVALAAFTLERLVCGSLGECSRRVLFAVASGGFAVGLFLVVLGAWNYFGVHLDIATPDERNRFHIWRGIRTLGVELAVAHVLLLVLLAEKPRLAAMGRVALPVFVLLLLVFHNRYFLRFEPLAGYLNYLHYQPVYAALDGAPERPLRVLEERAHKVDNILHDVGSPTGYHPVVPGGYERLMQTLGYSSDRFGKLMHVSYAHTYSRKPPEGTWQAHKEIRGGEEMLWRRPEVLPYLFAGVKLLRATDMAHAQELLADSFWNFREVAVAGPEVVGRFGVEAGPQASTVEMLEWQPRRIRFRAYSQRPAVLPMAEPHAPGWKAVTSDKARLPVVAVNIGQRAVVLPGGQVEVTMSYEPYSQRLGVYVSLVGGMMLLTGFASVAFRRRRIGEARIPHLVKAPNDAK